jgi:hypothetical protein
MSSDPKYIIGDLVELGTPEGSDQPRVLIHCKEGDIAAVKYVPMLRRVAIVPLEELNGSDVPPIVAENRRLLEQVARCQDVIYCLELCRAALEHHEEVDAAHGALEMHRHLYEMSGIAIRCLVAYGVSQDQSYWARVEQYRARMQDAREDKGGAA